MVGCSCRRFAHGVTRRVRREFMRSGSFFVNASALGMMSGFPLLTGSWQPVLLRLFDPIQPLAVGEMSENIQIRGSSVGYVLGIVYWVL